MWIGQQHSHLWRCSAKCFDSSANAHLKLHQLRLVVPLPHKLVAVVLQRGIHQPWLCCGRL